MGWGGRGADVSGYKDAAGKTSLASPLMEVGERLAAALLRGSGGADPDS